MIKFIIANPFDFILYLMPYSAMFRSMSQLFYKINSVEYMKKHGIEVIPIINFLDDSNMKYELMDYNMCQKYYAENNTSADNLKQIFKKCVSIFLEKVRTTDEFNGSVIYAIEPLGFDPFFAGDTFDMLKSKQIKVIMYFDDLHSFSIVRSGASLGDMFEMRREKLIFKDNRVENCSYLLTMSKYFHHIGIYQNKIKLYYVPVDDIVYSMYTPMNFFERKNKILMSGTVTGYPLRTQIYGAVVSAANSNHVVADKYYHILPCIGYGVTSLDNCKLTGLLSYYNILSEYQGAFVGYFRRPLDHVLWKVFEIMATGTLLFAEENKTLEDLGMRKFVHYIPMNEKNLFDANYLGKFLGTEEGKKIAINGYNFIREFHNNRKNLNFFINLIKNEL